MIDARKLDEALVKLIRLVKEKGGGHFDRVFDDVVESRDPYLAIVYGYVVGTMQSVRSDDVVFGLAREITVIDSLIDKGLSDEKILEELRKRRREEANYAYNAYFA